MWSRFAPVLFLWPICALGQTITTTNPLGFTVIEVITTNNLGLATTQTLQTLTSTPLLTTTPIPIITTTTSTSSSTTTTPLNQGPVGQPAASTVLGQTIYTYTTTDGKGGYTAIVATFIPTYPSSQPVPVPSTGTILGYSQWLSMVGTNTVNTALSSASGGTSPLNALKPLAVCVLAIACGSLLVFL